MCFITVTNATVTVIVFFHGNVTTGITGRNTAVKLPKGALEISGPEGPNISSEVKNVSYEEIFTKYFLAHNFLGKFWPGFS